MKTDLLEGAKCVVCGDKAVVIWPYVKDQPAFCNEHMKVEYSEKYGVWPEGDGKPNVKQKKNNKR